MPELKTQAGLATRHKVCRPSQNGLPSEISGRSPSVTSSDSALPLIFCIASPLQHLYCRRGDGHVDVVKRPMVLIRTVYNFCNITQGKTPPGESPAYRCHGRQIPQPRSACPASPPSHIHPLLGRPTRTTNSRPHQPQTSHTSRPVVFFQTLQDDSHTVHHPEAETEDGVSASSEVKAMKDPEDEKGAEQACKPAKETVQWRHPRFKAVSCII